MTFPTISHIDQVLPVIIGHDEFIHVIKDGYQVIDYVYESSGSFDDPIRRECRGIKFDMEGNLIARPLHKFFNYGQKEIVYDWSAPHTIMTKMDGSMVHAAIINGELRLCTRMGITDQSIAAEKLLTLRQKIELRSMVLYDHVTPIFEYVGPDNRIVIEYQVPRLVTIAIRAIETGEYWSYAAIKTWSELWGFGFTDSHGFTIGDDSIAELRASTVGIEGYVVAWADGTRTKIKGDDYCKMHHAVSYFNREDMILDAVLSGVYDDVLPSLSEDRAAKLRQYADDVLVETTKFVTDIEFSIDHAYHANVSRKDFAMWVNANVEQGLRAAYFSALDGKDIREAVNKCVLRNPELLDTRW